MNTPPWRARDRPAHQSWMASSNRDLTCAPGVRHLLVQGLQSAPFSNPRPRSARYGGFVSDRAKSWSGPLRTRLPVESPPHSMAQVDQRGQQSVDGHQPVRGPAPISRRRDRLRNRCSRRACHTGPTSTTRSAGTRSHSPVIRRFPAITALPAPTAVRPSGHATMRGADRLPG